VYRRVPQVGRAASEVFCSHRHHALARVSEGANDRQVRQGLLASSTALDAHQENFVAFPEVLKADGTSHPCFEETEDVTLYLRVESRRLQGRQMYRVELNS
jgi:hypothetical protein